MAFSVTTYNILATAFIKPERYPAVDNLALDSEYRLPRLMARVSGLGSDVICLQEVEPAVDELIRTVLERKGYHACFARKGANRPDGCATFIRKEMFRSWSDEVVHFADGPDGTPRSGHVALMVTLQHARGVLGIANTHFSWDAPDAPPAKRLGLRQARLLLAELVRREGGDAWIVCGDLNATHGSEIVRAFRDAGYGDAFGDGDAPYTCVTHGWAKRIDYLFHSHGLSAVAGALPAIDDGTALPNRDEPSDHLPVSATFDWVAAPQA